MERRGQWSGFAGFFADHCWLVAVVSEKANGVLYDVIEDEYRVAIISCEVGSLEFLSRVVDPTVAEQLVIVGEIEEGSGDGASIVSRIIARISSPTYGRSSPWGPRDINVLVRFEGNRCCWMGIDSVTWQPISVRGSVVSNAEDGMMVSWAHMSSRTASQRHAQ